MLKEVVITYRPVPDGHETEEKTKKLPEDAILFVSDAPRYFGFESAVRFKDSS